MGEGKGFGKVILFNERFVRFGIPSIVSAIEQVTIAMVKPFKGEGWSLNDRRPAIPGYKEAKLEQQKKSMELIFRAAGIDTRKNPFEITLDGDLMAASGIGASAASCVAIARALSDEFGLDLSDDRINEIAYEGERAYHGTPSGVDNTAATYGGLIWFKRGKPNIEWIRIKEPIEVVIGNTGIVVNTGAAAARVRKQREKYPEKYDKLFKRAEKIVHDARKALEDFDMKAVGRLMDENHSLLQVIGASCKELDFLIELAKDAGTLGAKMTGGGFGGSMVALTPGKDLQEAVARAIEKNNFLALRAKIGVP